MPNRISLRIVSSSLSLSFSPSRSLPGAFALAAALLLGACGNTNTGGGGGPHDGGGMDAHDQGILVTPDPANLSLTSGGPAVSQTFTAVAHTSGGDQDVSAMATWSLDDTGLGTFSGNTFTSGTTRGGTTLVHATFTPSGGGSPLTGSATLNVKLATVVTTTCPGCPPFPPSTTPPCAGATAAPTLVYPPDGVLLPPNMNVIEVQFQPGTGNDLFEIDFENAATDVRVETKCNAIMNVRGQPTGGCSYQLDQTVWDFVAQSNRGGDPVKVQVQGAPLAGTCIDHSDTRQIAFAKEDLNGGIYYWQSVVQGGIAGKTGGIFRHDFGDPASGSDPFLTPGSTNKCVGCHALSRDGTRMTFGSDDADSDDEYGDLRGNLYDVGMRSVIKGGLPAGFQAFSPDHKIVLWSDGIGSQDPPQFFPTDGDTGAGLAAVTFTSLAGKRVTQPDWSKDGKTIFFTVPGMILPDGARIDDDHFAAGSIYAMSFDATTSTYGPPMVVVQSPNGDENDYYPSISPDGQFLVFNKAIGTDLEGHDSFNNLHARLYASKLGTTPVDMVAANGGTDLTNSWPRWSPFIQTYKGKQLLWVTFSSTRDYGLRVENQNVPPALGGPMVNCYPPDSPENVHGSHGTPLPPNCSQPQIWMAAVSLSDLEFASGDPSFPAFWLPFQDVSAHNHIAQWTETVVGPPPGMCGMQGAMCSMAAPCCAGFTCDPVTMTCGAIIP